MELKKNIIYFLVFLILIPLISAETNFFDNPNDVFIMGSPLTGGAIIEETTDGTTSGGGCLYKWNCTNWSECLSSGKQTRNCTNIGTCSDTYKTPETEKNCTPIIYSEDEGEKIDEQDEIEKINWEEIVSNKILIFLTISLVIVILSIIFYLKKKTK